MTKQEVIKFLSLIKSTVFLGNRKFLDALDCAIELLTRPEPCEDAVSREAVSKWLKQYGQDVLHGKYKFSLMYIWKNLMDLPSVTPKQRWIPCYPSELPKNMLLWVTFDDGYGYRYVETVFWDMTEWNMDVSNAIAYMPYEEPEPYKEGDDEK